MFFFPLHLLFRVSIKVATIMHIWKENMNEAEMWLLRCFFKALR
jgi:hypothetical protein